MFKELGEMQIPRAYFLGVTASDIEDLQLHVFVDVSEARRAYACVAYFRTTGSIIAHLSDEKRKLHR